MTALALEVSNITALEELSNPIRSASLDLERETANVVTPIPSAFGELVATPVNLPPPAGRSTRSHTVPLALPAFTLNFVTFALNGTRNLVGESVRYVHLMLATQRLALGVPEVLPSVTFVAALPAVAAGANAELTATAATAPEIDNPAGLRRCVNTLISVSSRSLR